MQSQHNTELALSEKYTLNTLIYFEHHIYVPGCNVTARSREQKYPVGCYKSVIFQVVHALYVPSHITVPHKGLGKWVIQDINCLFSVFNDTVHFTAYIALDGMSNNELSIGKDSEGSSHYLIAVISRQLPGGNEDNHKIVISTTSVLGQIQT